MVSEDSGSQTTHGKMSGVVAGTITTVEPSIDSTKGGLPVASTTTALTLTLMLGEPGELISLMNDPSDAFWIGWMCETIRDNIEDIDLIWFGFTTSLPADEIS